MGINPYDVGFATTATPEQVKQMLTNARHAVVENTKDRQLDASRRDLTINALFLDLDGNVYDYYNGIDDLKYRRIRFVKILLNGFEKIIFEFSDIFGKILFNIIQ
jgi:tRNA nucleotidyltransferase/poly(A) polymerase